MKFIRNKKSNSKDLLQLWKKNNPSAAPENIETPETADNTIAASNENSTISLSNLNPYSLPATASSHRNITLNDTDKSHQPFLDFPTRQGSCFSKKYRDRKCLEYNELKDKS